VKPTLPELFDHYGSDKNRAHAYGPVYQKLLEPVRDTVTGVLEIGVADGASLRAWRDFFPKAFIIGMDKHSSRRVSEERITTVTGDQSDHVLLDTMADRYQPVDLIVDDGSHKLAHQIISVTCLLPLVKPGGFYIIEDVQDIDASFEPFEAMGGEVLDFRAETGIYDDVLVVFRNTDTSQVSS
jgi:cephalosporin hydroxylase